MSIAYVVMIPAKIIKTIRD